MSSFHSRHRQVGGRSFHLDRNKTDLLHACLPAMPLWHTAFNTREPKHLTASTRSSASWSFLLPHPPPWTARAHPGFATMGFPLPRLALIAICVNAHRDTAAPATAPQNCKNVKKQAVLSVWPPCVTTVATAAVWRWFCHCRESPGDCECVCGGATAAQQVTLLIQVWHPHRIASLLTRLM